MKSPYCTVCGHAALGIPWVKSNLGTRRDFVCVNPSCFIGANNRETFKRDLIPLGLALLGFIGIVATLVWLALG